MTKERVKVTPPWVGFFNKLKALFGEDPEITFRYIEDPITARIYVSNPFKAEALKHLLPKSKDFGGKTIYIEVIPANGNKITKASLFKAAFEGNPVFREMIDIEGVFVNPIHYCMFAKDVVQYWDDNFGDPHGNVSTLYQNLAEDIFEDTDGVIFCTDSY